MKPKVFPLIIIPFLIQSFFAFSQFSQLETAKLKCYFLLTWQEDSLNPFHIREEKMVLLLGNQTSLFCSYGSYFLDSVVQKNANMNVETYRQLNAPRRFAHHFRVMKNFLAGQITTSDRVFSDAYIYNEPMSKIQWKLTNETSQIKGYSVQKATTNFGGRVWEAWFAESIPFKDGPYKFSGLPGLILKIQDNKGHYIFEIESIQATNENVYTRHLSNDIQTNKRQFIEIQKKFSQDAAGSILTSGVPLHQSQNADLKIIEDNMRRRNNPIELTAD